jgi:hypothetical protein
VQLRKGKWEKKADLELLSIQHSSNVEIRDLRLSNGYAISLHSLEMRLTPIVWSLLCVSHHAAAAPYFFESQPMPTLDDRSLLKGFRKFLGGIAGVAFDDAVGGLLQQVESAVNAGDRDALLNAMQNLKPTASPTNVEDASSAIKAVAMERPSSLFEFNSKLVANGIIFGTMPEILGNTKNSRTGENSNQNV